MNARECARCRRPLPVGATARRVFCSDTCRVYAARGVSVTAPALWSSAQHETPVLTAAPLSESTPTASAAPRRENRPLAAIAAGIPTPVDEYGPARAYCEARDGGHGVVFGLDGGRVNQAIGPVFPRPRSALDLAALLNERITPAASAV